MLISAFWVWFKALLLFFLVMIFQGKMFLVLKFTFFSMSGLLEGGIVLLSLFRQAVLQPTRKIIRISYWLIQRGGWEYHYLLMLYLLGRGCLRPGYERISLSLGYEISRIPWYERVHALNPSTITPPLQPFVLKANLKIVIKINN